LAIAPHLKRLRELVGHELLVLPAVAVLVWDQDERLLLVRSIDSGKWQTVGGAIEPDESPHQAAVRETSEEAGVTVELTRLRGVVGGPAFRQTYPNGDQTSYVSIVFDARAVDGQTRPDGDETDAVQWWSPSDLAGGDLTSFTRALLAAVDVAG
jgi:ADP-ribose pyrophosphatase YjhB (NUDIX family)